MQCETGVPRQLREKVFHNLQTRSCQQHGGALLSTHGQDLQWEGKDLFFVYLFMKPELLHVIFDTTVYTRELVENF